MKRPAVNADEVAREIADARWPKGPLGISAGGRITGHPDGLEGHPAWCSPAECTAMSDLPVAYHLSAWQTVYPQWGDDIVIRARLYTTAYAPIEEEAPQLEILFDRCMSTTSIEGYELAPGRAHHFADALRGLADAAADPEHWLREVQPCPDPAAE